MYGIFQTAGFPHDGHCAVAHGNQLGQAAGLEQAGHQEGVRARVDLMGDAFVVSDIGADKAPIFLFIVPEGVFIPRVAGAKHHHLGIAVHQVGEDGVDQVQAFLVGQAGNQPQHKPPGDLVQLHFGLQVLFVSRLPLQEIFCVIGRFQQGVRIAVPDVCVDAVDDAAQLWLMVAQVAVQPFPVGRSLDFLGIGGADRGNPVGKGQAALEHVAFLFVDLQHRVVEQVVRQAGPVLQVGNAANALEPEVVDGEHGFRLADGCDVKAGFQIHWHQGSLPVVAVDHIRNPFQIIQYRQGCLGEVAVLGNILPQPGIGIAPVEKFLVVNEVINDAVHFGFHDADEESPSLHRQVHHKGAFPFQLFLVLHRHTVVQGQDDPNFAVVPDQGAGQGVHDVSQSAGFNKRIAFGADKGDFAPGSRGNSIFRHNLFLPFRSIWIFFRPGNPGPLSVIQYTTDACRNATVFSQNPALFRKVFWYIINR